MLWLKNYIISLITCTLLIKFIDYMHHKKRFLNNFWYIIIVLIFVYIPILIYTIFS